ncbi:transcription factor GTE3 [Acrasis kona]|uniref:Transcription factor GTE3 n=1 Tax=Acrasis kona TaxID=1008807 RepID=A0AAW2ZLW6_9EUKA
MDLGTVDKKLTNNEYNEIEDFCNDVNLVWNNCISYNQPGSDVVKMADELKKLFSEKWNKLLQDLQSGILSPENDLKRRTSSASATYKEDAVVEEKKPKPARPARSAPKKKAQPKKKATPTVIDAKEMTFEEKRKLGSTISTLEQDCLRKVVEIIQKQAPKASSKANELEIEVDLDKLDAITLRTLEEYVNSALSNNNNTTSNSADAAAPSETNQQHKKKKKNDQDSESSGGSSDESSNTESSSDSGSSDSDSENEKEKFMNMNMKNESAPQSLTNQPAPTEAVPPAATSPIQQSTPQETTKTGSEEKSEQEKIGMMMPTLENAKAISIENESGWSSMMMDDSDEESSAQQPPASTSFATMSSEASSNWTDFQNKSQQLAQRQKEREELRVRDMEEKQRRLEQEVKSQEDARIQAQKRDEMEREIAAKEREKFEASQKHEQEEQDSDLNRMFGI